MEEAQKEILKKEFIEESKNEQMLDISATDDMGNDDFEDEKPNFGLQVRHSKLNEISPIKRGTYVKETTRPSAFPPPRMTYEPKSLQEQI